jgi:hypothetical protein
MMFGVHYRFKKSLEQTSPQIKWQKMLALSP